MGSDKDRPKKRQAADKKSSAPSRKSNSAARKPQGNPFPPQKRKRQALQEPVTDPQGMRLNRYLAHAGLCSRRQADDLIKSGKVKVNGEVITELGTRVPNGASVEYMGKPIKPQQAVYVLLNKPKDVITTTSDDRGRRTVMDLLEGVKKKLKDPSLRIYPVGRLDRGTTGLLLFTNDGELAEKLSHPRYEIKKVYHITLDKSLTASHFAAIQDGIKLDDGFIKADDIAFPNPDNKKDIGLEIHSGRNRIVRRIFEHLGYKVSRLDRVYYAGLTKKDLPRGRWRLLSQEEIVLLKHYGQVKR